MSLAREEERGHDRDGRDAEYHADGWPAHGLGHVQQHCPLKQIHRVWSVDRVNK